MIICRCNEVSQKEIQTFLKKHPGAKLEDVIKHTRASDSCGKCRPVLTNLLHKIKRNLAEDDQLQLGF